MRIAVIILLTLLGVWQVSAQLTSTGVGKKASPGPPPSGPVTVDSANCNPATMQYKASASTQTLTGVTITSGANLGLVVSLNFDLGNGTTTPTVSSLVWDAAGANQSLSLIVAETPNGSTGPSSQLWGRVGITAGASKSITLTTTNSQPVFMDACAFTNVDQTGGATSFPNSTTGASVSTVNVTSAANHIVLAASYSLGSIGTVTGTTIYNDNTSANFINAFSNYDAGAATVTIGTSNSVAGIAATDIKNAP